MRRQSQKMARHSPKEASEENKSADLLITDLIPRSLRKHLLKLPGMGYFVMATLVKQYSHFLLK